MPRTRRRTGTAVIDASCLIYLLHLDSTLNLNLFRALSLGYNNVYIPRYVWQEVSRKEQSRHRLRRLLQQYSFLQQCKITNAVDVHLLCDPNLPPGDRIDRGEAEAIIQARELGAPEVLLDEKKARRMATGHGLSVKGTLGLLAEFERNNIIQDMDPLIEKLKKDRNFRIDEKLLRQVRKEMGRVD